ncbi:MDR family NADP-dependent oxidoreductase [Aspergillus lucknowensis]|uniref:NAD(P)-binding protein n=1 Tax=Aspergillus lucknowensis TaxID=176173 RepID=A0ABR4M286_9EURO
MSMSTRQYVLNATPQALPILTGPTPTFKLSTTPLPPISPTQALLKTLLVSNDPAQRIMLNGLPPDTPIPALVLAQVLESGSPEKLPTGSIVFVWSSWTEYAVREIESCRVVEPIEGLSLGHFLGALGTNGLTAYYGLVEIVKARREDTVVVSGAAGATGSMAVQIARGVLGCKRVIGIAGSDEKCRWVEKLGADVCVNYKKASFEEDLVRATDGLVDVFFDNVAGRILDLMLDRMKHHGRVALCGTITGYNDSDAVGVKNLHEIVTRGVSIHGFTMFDYMHKVREVIALLAQAWKEGKIVLDDSLETLVEAPFEDVPRVWMRLFEGGNTGKLVTKFV